MRPNNIAFIETTIKTKQAMIDAMQKEADNFKAEWHHTLAQINEQIDDVDELLAMLPGTVKLGE